MSSNEQNLKVVAVEARDIRFPTSLQADGSDAMVSGTIYRMLIDVVLVVIPIFILHERNYSHNFFVSDHLKNINFNIVILRLT